ncbi:MAG: RNA polymerase sigma factor [Sandaracinaceae bacterium]|nr:RNA polymerase sigma factor [Sandaracinaceae bacterium]
MAGPKSSEGRDQALLERARRGDGEAMQALLTELSPSVRRFGQQLCRHEADAMDVMQDTLLAVASHLGDFEQRAALSSWVYALARSACNRRRRGLKNQAHLPESAVAERADSEATPEERLEAAEVGRSLGRALCGLPDSQREVIVLRDLMGLSASETAKRLGISVPALKSRLHRARAALREAFETLGPATDEGDWDCAPLPDKKK